MRTLASLALLLGLLAAGSAQAREVDDASTLDAQTTQKRGDSTKREKEPAVQAKYDASYPVRDVVRARKPTSI